MKVMKEEVVDFLSDIRGDVCVKKIVVPVLRAMRDCLALCMHSGGIVPVTMVQQMRYTTAKHVFSP